MGPPEDFNLQVIAGQVWTYDVPTLAFVLCHVYMVGKGIKSFWIVFAKEYGEIPLETIFHALSTIAHRIIWPHIDSSNALLFVVHTVKNPP